jgi:hypothetical protein
MTVILAANYPSYRLLMADVFVADGSPAEYDSYGNITDKTFQYGANSDVFFAVIGDESFALILQGEGKCPGVDLSLRHGDPRDPDFAGELAAAATRYRAVVESTFKSEGSGAPRLGAQNSTLYMATRDELRYWDFEFSDGSFTCTDDSGIPIPPKLAFLHCGCKQPFSAKDDIEDPLVTLIPRFQCHHLRYVVGNGVTGVALPSDRWAPPVRRRLSDLSDEEKIVKFRE